MNKELC
jgi:glutathione S-transferase